jgi:hypothetical protein
VLVSAQLFGQQGDRNGSAPFVAIDQAKTADFVSIDFPAPGVTDTECTGITPFGVIVGRYFTADGKQHGFVLSYGHYVSINIGGTDTSTDAAWVNARGDIAGSYQVTVQVPEL